jgi:hypothetical protein
MPATNNNVIPTSCKPVSPIFQLGGKSGSLSVKITPAINMYPSQLVMTLKLNILVMVALSNPRREYSRNRRAKPPT